jgi:hypothetical protein
MCNAKQVREAMKAGVVFDIKRMKEMNCWSDEFESPTDTLGGGGIPKIEVSTSQSDGHLDLARTPTSTSHATTAGKPDARTHLLNAYTRGKIHDCLQYPSGGLSLAGTIGWKVMEYLPFRRMDLQRDGSWKPIIWPLPCGEVRDIPENAKVHNSVIRRMWADPKYRPGNLLVGGGGRGVRKAPASAGTGEWIVLREEGSLVGEVFVKKEAFEKGLVKQG